MGTAASPSPPPPPSCVYAVLVDAAGVPALSPSPTPILVAAAASATGAPLSTLSSPLLFACTSRNLFRSESVCKKSCASDLEGPGEHVTHVATTLSALRDAASVRVSIAMPLPPPPPRVQPSPCT